MINDGYYKTCNDPVEGVPVCYIKNCPCCGKQIAIYPKWVLPTGYDNPANPISMYPPYQVGRLDFELYGGKDTNQQ